MKKKIILIIALLLTPIIKVKASSGLIDIYASNKNPTVGSTITITTYTSCDSDTFAYEYTITYDESKLSFISSSSNCNNLHCAASATSKTSDTFTFKVIAQGESTVSVKASGIIDSNEESITPSISPVKINAKSSASTPPTNNSSTPSSNSSTTNKTFSTNNYLKSLSVDNKTLSPDFNKDTLEYTVIFNEEDEIIKINAEKEDDKATIAGLGEQKLDLGKNKYEITVTSEKGTTRTYTITAIIEDKNPIKVEINKNDYTVVKRKSLLPIKENYEEKTITINEQQIPALYNKQTNITLIGLKNTKTSEINLFIYDEEKKSYTTFNEIKIGDISLTILNNTKKEYQNKTTIRINDQEIEVYKTSKESKYSIIYAINNTTGKKSWYKYDEEENTIQRQENEIKESKNNNTAKNMVLILGITSLSFAILFIISLIRNISIKKEDKKKENKKVQ